MRISSLKWRRLIVGVALGGTAFAGSLGTGVTAASADSQSPVLGQVYVNDNTTGTNTIAAFDRHVDGTLTALSGSPFAAGGAGTGSGLASQGAIQMAGDGRFVVAVDAGSNEISVLRVEKGGGLTLLPGRVISSGGTDPVSVAVHGALVYVANANAAAPNYTGFTLSPAGKLTPLAGSTIPLPPGSQPGDVTFNSTGQNFIGVRVATSKIDSFSVGANGLLVAAANSPIAAQAAGPFGSEFRPTDASQLFVSNAHAGPGAGSVSAFSTSSDGTLSSIGASPFANGQSGTCWVELTPDGNFLFAVNTGSGTIARYSVAPDGSLTLLGSTGVASQAGVGAVDARISPDGKTLFVDESRVDSLGAFAVDGGNLTELPSSPTALPPGASPAGIAIS